MYLDWFRPKKGTIRMFQAFNFFLIYWSKMLVSHFYDWKFLFKGLCGAIEAFNEFTNFKEHCHMLIKYRLKAIKAQ